MFQVLQRKMKKKPVWKHARDVYNWTAIQPEKLSSRKMDGISMARVVLLSYSSLQRQPSHLQGICGCIEAPEGSFPQLGPIRLLGAHGLP